MENPEKLAKVSKKQTELLTEFESEFTQDQLSVLRSIGENSPEDSKFILKCVRFLYADNLDVLKFRSVTGRSNGSVKKEPMSEKKKQLLSEMYSERLNSLDLDNNIKKERFKQLNKHIKDAIVHAGRADDKKQRQQDLMKSINDKLSQT